MNNTTIRKFLRNFIALVLSTLFALFAVRYILSVHDYEQAQHDKYIHSVVSSNGAQVVSTGKGE